MNPYIAQNQAVAAQQPGMQAANMGDGGAGALMGLSHAFDQVSQVAAQYEHHKAIQSAGKIAADATTQWMQRMQELKQNAPDGAPEFTANLQKEFDAYTAQTLKNTPNAVAQEFLRNRLEGLKTHLTGEAVAFQAHAQVASAENGFKTTLENSGKVMATDTSEATYQRLQQAFSDQVGTSTLPAALKLQYARMGRENLAKSQALALTQQDPKAVYESLAGDPTGAPKWVADLPIADRISIMSHSRSMWHQQMGVSREELSSTISQQMDQLSKGQVVPLIPKQTFMSAFPTEAEAQTKWEQYQAKSRGVYAKTKGIQSISEDPEGAFKTFKGGNGLGENIQGPPTAENSWLTDLSPQDRMSLESHAFSQWHQQMGVVRAGLEQKIADQENRFVNGMEVSTPLTKPEFLKAYPVDQAEAKWTQYQAKQQLGADLVSMKNLPSVELDTLLKTRKAEMEAAPEGQTSAQLDRYNRTVEAAQRILKARMDDPIGVAIQNKQFGVQPLDYSDPAGFIAGLKARQAAVQTIRTDWGVPAGPFTKDEAAKAIQYLSTTSEAGTLPQMQFLQRVKQALPDPVVYGAAMRQIADGDPVVATAGHILGQNLQAIGKPAGMLWGSAQMIPQEVVASRMLDGLNAMKTGKGAIGGVNEKDFRNRFNAEAGEAFASSPSALEATFQSAKAYAVGKLSQTGQLKEMADGKISDDLMRESIRAVTGGVIEINGKKTLPPYGLDEPHFKAMLMRGFDAAIESAGIPQTSPMSRFGAYQFVPGGGANRYMVTTAAGTLLNPKTQMPVIVDLNDQSGWRGVPITPQPTRAPFTGPDATGPAQATDIKTTTKKPTK